MRCYLLMLVLFAPLACGVSGNQSGEAGAPVERTDRKLTVYPLQEWMRATLLPAVREARFADLELSLNKLAVAAPPHYDGWAEISRRGAGFAHSHDIDGVKQACSDCHNAHRVRYRSSHGAVSLSTDVRTQ